MNNIDFNDIDSFVDVEVAEYCNIFKDSFIDKLIIKYPIIDKILSIIFYMVGYKPVKWVVNPNYRRYKSSYDEVKKLIKYRKIYVGIDLNYTHELMLITMDKYYLSENRISGNDKTYELSEFSSYRYRVLYNKIMNYLIKYNRSPDCINY
jgi:hypothetical protein